MNFLSIEVDSSEAVGIVAMLFFIAFILMLIYLTESFWLTIVGMGIIFIPFGIIAEWQHKRINNKRRLEF